MNLDFRTIDVLGLDHVSCSDRIETWKFFRPCQKAGTSQGHRGIRGSGVYGMLAPDGSGVVVSEASGLGVVLEACRGGGAFVSQGRRVVA